RSSCSREMTPFCPNRGPAMCPARTRRYISCLPVRSNSPASCAVKNGRDAKYWARSRSRLTETPPRSARVSRLPTEYWQSRAQCYLCRALRDAPFRGSCPLLWLGLIPSRSDALAPLAVSGIARYWSCQYFGIATCQSQCQDISILGSRAKILVALV